jgi:predicted glycoside hydrolase/deacetylase ChbG (UPF0249 family)
VKLIVIADDYGLTPGVSRAILRAHRDGVVTATSVLVVGPAFTEAAPWLADHPDLAVGLHLALVGEDPPVLAPAEIPSLVRPDGSFCPNWRQLIRRRLDPADLERELSAQRQRLVDAGLTPSHLNLHQHVHLWPPIGAVVTELARRWQVPVVRVPDDRARRAVRPLAHRLRRRIAEAGLRTTDAFAGLVGAGHQHGARLARTLDRLAAERPAWAELVVHPGADDAAERYRWGYDWGAEAAALTGPTAARLVAERGFTLASPVELAAA